MTGQGVTPTKPPVHPTAKWRKELCRCSYGMLLCFGLPLLPPSGILLGLAFGTQTEFGVFHVVGFILTIISVSCISIGVFIIVSRKFSLSKHSAKVNCKHVPDVVVNTPRTRSPSSNSLNTTGSGSSTLKKSNAVTLVTETEVIKRPRKKRKRKHEKSRSKLAPVKEEDGRARFEKTLEEREKSGHTLHKRTKSESRKGFEEYMYMSAIHNPVKTTLTYKQLKSLGIHDSQGSQESLQMKRSMSLSDIGDSNSEITSTDFSDSPQVSRRPEDSGSKSSRPVLVSTSASRAGVRASTFSSIL